MSIRSPSSESSLYPVSERPDWDSSLCTEQGCSRVFGCTEWGKSRVPYTRGGDEFTTGGQNRPIRTLSLSSRPTRPSRFHEGHFNSPCFGGSTRHLRRDTFMKTSHRFFSGTISDHMSWQTFCLYGVRETLQVRPKRTGLPIDVDVEDSPSTPQGPLRTVTDTRRSQRSPCFRGPTCDLLRERDGWGIRQEDGRVYRYLLHPRGHRSLGFQVLLSPVRVSRKWVWKGSSTNPDPSSGS